MGPRQQSAAWAWFTTSKEFLGKVETGPAAAKVAFSEGKATSSRIQKSLPGPSQPIRLELSGCPKVPKPTLSQPHPALARACLRKEFLKAAVPMLSSGRMMSLSQSSEPTAHSRQAAGERASTLLTELDGRQGRAVRSIPASGPRPAPLPHPSQARPSLFGSA